MLYRHRLFLEDGSEAGEAHYAMRIQPGETIWTKGALKLRVLDSSAFPIVFQAKTIATTPATAATAAPTPPMAGQTLATMAVTPSRP